MRSADYIAFTLGGIASLLGVWLPEGRLFREWRLRTILVLTTLLSAAAHVLLALSNEVWPYVIAFTIASFLNAAVVPVINSLIAFNVRRTRRGTAFGIASAAQAVAFAALIVLAVREPAGAH